MRKVSWLVLSMLLALPGAQAQTPLEEEEIRQRRARFEQLLQEAKRNEIRPDAGRVNEAARSPETLWAFLVDPATVYDDRMRAAERAKDVLRPWQIPLLIAAKYDLAAEAWQHSWWRRAPDMPPATPMEPRLMFGLPWQPHTPPVAPGNTIAEWRRMPWPWQVERALQRIHIEVVATKGIDVVRDLPCASERDEHVVLSTLAYFPRTPETFGVWRNLIARRGDRIFTPSWYSDDHVARDHADWAAQAFAADISSAQRDLLGRIASQVGFMRKGEMPHTALLAVAKRIDELALDPGMHCQLAHAAAQLVQAADAPPFPPYPQFSELQQCHDFIADFHGWLETHREALERGAAAERVAIDTARARMEAVTLCR